MKIILHLSRFARLALFACLVSTALALSVVRFWLLPRAADWREELQAKVGTMIDETVHIKALSAAMRGFKPELMMRGLHIDNAAQDGPALEFDRLGVGLDMVDSFLQRRPVIDRIELEGGRLRLLRKADGTVAVVGLRPSAHPPAWLFAEGELRFADIDLELVDGLDGPVMALGRAQARLRNQGGSHALEARLDLPGKLGKSVRLSAEVDGNPLQSSAWQGRAYLEAKRLREGAFGESLPVRLRSGEVGFQVWGEWRNGSLGEVVAKLELERPVFTWRGTAGRPDGLLNLDRLSGGLRWRKEEQGWRLDAKHLAFAQNGKSWPETDFALAVDRDGDGGLRCLRAAFSYLHLDDTPAFLSGLSLLEEKDRETLRTLAPRGEVRDARLLYQADGRFGFCGDLTGVGIKQTQDWPDIGRFTGRLCGNDRDGRIDLDLAKTALNLPGLFPKPVPVDALSGSLAWHRSGGNLLLPAPQPAQPAAAGPPAPGAAAKWFAGSGWRLVANQIKLAAPGLQASGGFALVVPAGEGGSPSIELDAQLREVDIARLRDYLPLTAMDAEAARWHGNAYHGGKLTRADVLLRGRLADFPFPQGEGLFQALGEVENMELEFNPQWPHLYGVKAKLLFFGPSMFVDSEGGRIGDIPWKTVHAGTGSFVGDAWLDVTGAMDVDLAPALKMLQQTPVRAVPQRLAKVADAAGGAHLDLKLALPLGAGEAKLAGQLQLKNDSLAFKGINLNVQDINGGLGFTEAGMEGRQITAKALDAPILVDMSQKKDDILIDIVGKAGVAALGKAFPGGLWQQAEGAFDYRLNLQIPKSLDAASSPLRVAVASDLGGLELKLPAPLAKPAALKKDFGAELNLRQGGRSSLRVAYGAEGLARLSFASAEGFKLESGDVFWGKPQTPASSAPGLGLYLKLNALDLGVWHKLLADNGAAATGIAPRALDIQVDKLSWNGEDLGPLSLTGDRDGGGLFGEVECRYGRGRYNVANPEFGHASLGLDLDILSLPKLPEQGQMTSPDPASLPALQVRARRLLRQGADLGELDLETEHWTAGMNIKRLRLLTDNHELAAKGGWMRQDGRDETKLEGTLNVRDLGHFLTLLGYGKEILYTPTESAFSFAWNGAPQQFSTAILSGEIKLKMGRGSVLQMEPGLGRAMGMLNLQTLRRLLLLDFSDLFGKGLAYDSMEGSFKLSSGQARTKGFVIDAAAADILVLGRVGLADHDFDQTVSVMPHPLASIPLAGALVGGAAVGAVIDLAHRLVGAEAVNIASTNYAITGTWDNPQIKRIQGSIPMQMIDRAWSGIKDMSGMESQGDGGRE